MGTQRTFSITQASTVCQSHDEVSMKKIRKLMDRLVATPGKKISLKDYDPDWTGNIKDKKEAITLLDDGVKLLAKQQDKLYAQDTYSLLMVFQAMDAAGKDGTIRHVMSGVNPQGCQVFSFKAPSAEERDHDYLWRIMKALPERGRIGIHNRSYYEEVLVAACTPRSSRRSSCRRTARRDGVWKNRFEQINNFERYLVDNGTVVLKFFLHVSKKEQKRRFLERIDERRQELEVLGERRQGAHVLEGLHARLRGGVHAHEHQGAPWYIIPADNKWFMRLAVAAITYQTLADLNLKYPTLTKGKETGAARSQESADGREGLIAVFQRRRRRPFAPHGRRLAQAAVDLLTERSIALTTTPTATTTTAPTTLCQRKATLVNDAT